MKVPQGIEQTLVAAADLFNSPPLLLLLVGHCLACANFVRGKYGDRWLINNLAGFAIAFGGGSMSALLLQARGACCRGRAPAVLGRLFFHPPR